MHRRLLLVAILPASFVAAATGPIQLRLEVRPEVAIAASGGGYVLKIRLANNTVAHVWRDDACGVSPDGAYLVDRSGTHTVPRDVLSRRSGSRLCVVSSDGALRASEYLPSIGTSAAAGDR